LFNYSVGEKTDRLNKIDKICMYKYAKDTIMQEMEKERDV